MAMDWDKLRVFHAVADAGSFTHAGERLHLSQSAISRQILGLEESLGMALFHRHARGLLLTEQGELLNRTVREVFAKLEMTHARLAHSTDQPQGPLRVTTTVAFGSLWLTPRVREFLELYPEIDLTIIATDQDLDLGMREADCAVRSVRPTQPDLVRRQLTQVHSHLFASPEYINEHGMPATAGDLDCHRLISFGEDGVTRLPSPSINWLFEVGRNDRPRDPVLRINNVYGILRAVQTGLGIGALPDFLASEAENLVRVLPDLEGPANHAWFVYPTELRKSRRLAVFRDFIVQKVAESRF